MGVFADELIARLDRVQVALDALQHRSNRVRMVSAGGEVEVYVDSAGRLVDLRLAPTATAHLAYEPLEVLINDTWRAAIDAASSIHCGRPAA